MIVDRILNFIEYKGLSKNKFYKETGLSNGFLDKVKDIGCSKLELILNTYPEISIEWLLTGKGNMLKEANSKDLSNINIVELLEYLLNNNDQLLKDESFRNYIRMNMEYLTADEERELQKQAIQKLRKIALEKVKNKEL